MKPNETKAKNKTKPKNVANFLWTNMYLYFKEHQNK